MKEFIDTFNKITFSRKFTKLKDDYGNLCRFVCLLEVIRVRLKDLSRRFLDYDTDYGEYKLPKDGDYLLLLFRKTPCPGLFTTLRRRTPRKEDFYRDSIGKVFRISVPQEGDFDD